MSSALTYNNKIVDVRLMAWAKQVNQSLKRFALGPGAGLRDSASLNRSNLPRLMHCRLRPSVHSPNGEKERKDHWESGESLWPTCLSEIIWHCRQDLNRDLWRREGTHLTSEFCLQTIKMYRVNSWHIRMCGALLTNHDDYEEEYMYTLSIIETKIIL